MGPAARSERPRDDDKPRAPKPPTTIATFELRPGDTLETELRSKMITQPGGELQATVAITRQRRIEIIDADRGVIMKARVTYAEDRQDVKMSGNALPDRSMLTDTTFISTWNSVSGDWAFDTGGASLDDDRRRRLLDDIRAFIGQPDYVTRAVAGKPLPKIGALIELPRGEIGKSLADEAEVKTAVVRLVELRGDIAVLEQVLVFSGSDRGQRYDISAILLVEIACSTGRRIKQSAVTTLSWLGTRFDGRDVLTYRYITPGR